MSSAVADRLDARWTDARAHHIAGFYDNEGLIAHMNEELGIVEPENEGYHDSYWITALQMVTDPETVRYRERVAAGKASINGVSIADLEATLDVGRKLMKWRVDRAVELIRRAIGSSSSNDH